MIYFFFFLWIACAVFVIKEHRIIRVVIYLGVFTLLSSLCFFLLAAPDVAMAEIVVSAFSTVFFIICLEKHFGLGADNSDDATSVTPDTEKVVLAPKKRLNAPLKQLSKFARIIAPIAFAAGLFALFLVFAPESPASTYLRDLYVERFRSDVGGTNAVTSIYLGYRMYDTLFEALMLLVSVVAVAHFSWFETLPDGRQGHVDSKYALPIIRAISPFMLLFGIYIIANGHQSPGGGFQGGVVIATFFICRYLVLDIGDIKVSRFITVEKIIYFAIALLAVLFVFIGVGEIASIPPSVYLVLMNSLIGLKVAFGFIIILYRYIAFERR